MAEFQSHLNNYDSQLEEAKKKAGDATLEVTKIGERVTLFERNLTSLRGGLDSLRTDHKETDSNLNLMTLVSVHTLCCLSMIYMLPVFIISCIYIVNSIIMICVLHLLSNIMQKHVQPGTLAC